MESTQAAFVAAGPEAILQLAPTVLSSSRTELSVPAGVWFSDAQAGAARGALAIPLDDATGYVVAAGAPEGYWPVSLGIRVDFLADPGVSGAPMTAVGEVVGRDARGGLTRGEIRDDQGGVVAVVTQRSHLLAMSAPTTPALDYQLPEVAGPIREVLGFVESAPGKVELPPNTLAANEMGNIHGGVLICGAEFSAMSAVKATGDFRTTSIDATYLRPGEPGAPIEFRSTVRHSGRSVTVVDVVATGQSGKPSVLATVILQPASS